MVSAWEIRLIDENLAGNITVEYQRVSKSIKELAKAWEIGLISENWAGSMVVSNMLLKSWPKHRKVV